MALLEPQRILPGPPIVVIGLYPRPRMKSYLIVYGNGGPYYSKGSNPVGSALWIERAYVIIYSLIARNE